MRVLFLSILMISTCSPFSLNAMERAMEWEFPNNSRLMNSPSLKRNAVDVVDEPKAQVNPKVNVLGKVTGELTILERSLREYLSQINSKQVTPAESKIPQSAESPKGIQRKSSIAHDLKRGFTCMRFKRFFKKTDTFIISDVQGTNITESPIEEAEASLPRRFAVVGSTLEDLDERILNLPSKESQDTFLTLQQFKEQYLSIVSLYNKSQARDENYRVEESHSIKEVVRPSLTQSEKAPHPEITRIGGDKFNQLKSFFENPKVEDIQQKKTPVLAKKNSIQTEIRTDEVSALKRETAPIQSQGGINSDVPPSKREIQTPIVKSRSSSSPLRKRVHTWTKDMKSTLSRPLKSTSSFSQRSFNKPVVQESRGTFTLEEFEEIRSAIAKSLSQQKEAFSSSERELLEMITPECEEE